MSDSFSISRTACLDLTPDALRREIQERTGNESATDGIIRSMERFGSDESIQYFEMIPQQAARTRLAAPSMTWTVRAMR